MTANRFKFRAPLTLCVAVFLLPLGASADRLGFVVALDNLPGVDELESGDIDAGLAKLEAQLANTNSERWHEVIATLCGAYVLASQYDKAVATCDRAVLEAPHNASYNNRGVLRVHLGQLDSALSDFEIARPDSLDSYIAVIRATDPALIAFDNTQSLLDLRARLEERRREDPFRVSSASIENVLVE